MRFNTITCLAVLLLTAVSVNANTVWNAVDANDIADGYSNWNIANNWTLGVPGTAAPADTKAVFNVAAAVECRLTDPQACVDLVMGDGGAAVAPEDNLLRIMEGGSLNTTGSWMSIGYNHPAKLVVEKGGVYQHAGHFWWGMHTGGDAVVEIDGGFVTNGGSFGLGEYFGPSGDHGQCKVYIRNDGELNIHHWSGGLTSAHPVFWNDSLIDIEFGKMVIRNNSAGEANEYIAAGKITGFGIVGNAAAVYANGVTTITADDPMDRAPAYTTVLAGPVNLTWTNLPPVAPATDVWVDVWFGTDPNKLSLAYSNVVTQGKNATSAVVDALSITEPTTYYWQVDSYVYGDPAIVDYSDPNIPVLEGAVTPFDVTFNTPPSVVIETAPTMTWINEPIPLDSTLTDDHPEQVTYLWTSDDPNALFLPSNTVADPTVAVDYHAAQFTVTVTVDDGFNVPASASVTHDCAASPCQAADSLGFDDLYLGDIVGDCVIDLRDFAAIAREWLTDYALTGPAPVPQP